MGRDINHPIIGNLLMHFMHHIDDSDENTITCRSPDNCGCHLSKFNKDLKATMKNVLDVGNLKEVEGRVSTQLVQAKKVFTDGAEEDEDKSYFTGLIDEVAKKRK